MVRPMAAAIPRVEKYSPDTNASRVVALEPPAAAGLSTLRFARSIGQTAATAANGGEASRNRS